MTEARNLIENLKRSRDAKEENLAEIEDQDSQEAITLSAEIEELDAIVKAYESILNKLDSEEIVTEDDQARYDEAISSIVTRLKDFNEGYVRSEDILSRTTELDEALDEIARSDDRELDVENDENNTDSSEDNEEEEELEDTDENTNDDAQDEEQVEEEISESAEETRLKASESQYQKLMYSRIAKLEAKIAKIKKRPGFSGRKAEAIRGYEIEIAALREEANNYRDRTRLDPEVEEKLAEMDDKHEENITKITDYEKEIKELKEIREGLTTRKDKRELKKLIKALESKKIDLKIKDKSLKDTESMMLEPGYKKEMKARSKVARAEGIIASNEDSLAVNEELKSMLNPENSFIDSIKERIYDIRGAHYLKRIAKAQERLQELERGDVPIRLNGARTTSATREYLDGLRQRNSEQLEAQEGTQRAA